MPAPRSTSTDSGTPPSRSSDPGDSAGASAGHHLLDRLCRRPRVHHYLERLSTLSSTSIQVSLPDGTVLLTAGSPPAERTGPCRATVSLPHARTEVAVVAVTGDAPSAGEVAHLAGSWLEELLSYEEESASLTGAVVHAYEELHLLYELGEILGGVLELERVCELVVQAIVTPLEAVRASLKLFSQENEITVATASNGEPPADADRTLLCAEAALRVNSEPIGRLVVESKRAGGEFSSNDLKLLEGVAAVSAPAIFAAQLYERARYQADRDGLTKIYNHRWLQGRLDGALERAQRLDEPLTIFLADLDNFKLFNDVYGHPVGDRVLKLVGASLTETIRPVDVVGRYGGDEFLVILPGIGSQHAMPIADRILDHIAQQGIVINEEHLPIAISLGIACFPADATTKHELIACADTALYESKRTGGRMASRADGTYQDWLNLPGGTFNVLHGLVQTVDAKDRYTREHSEVVTEAALLLARRLNLSDETQRALRIAGLLHDVGKIGIPDQVLKKPGALTEEEYEIIKQHVELSQMIIKNVPHLNDVLDAVAHHHERYDGKGYPQGKQRDEIPLLGRIMAIADAYSAMGLDRPYRKRRNWSEMRQEFMREAGRQFDPELVTLFIAAMDECDANWNPDNRLVE